VIIDGAIAARVVRINVLFFVATAAAFGVLATSYSRRHRTRRSFAVIGALGGPLMLLFVLVVLPTALASLGVMPASG
jgi:hypothetical protein